MTRPTRLTLVKLPRPARCPFCGRDATEVCTHPVQSPRIVFPPEVQEGDWLLSNRDQGAFYEVMNIEAPIDWVTFREFRFVLLEDGRRRMRGYTAHMPTAVMEIGKCGRRVCDRHVREFDDETRQCAEHWAELDRVFSVE